MVKKQTKKTVTHKNSWYAVALTRILLGFVFLWAFLDKTFGLGYATEPAKAWINGGSPTTGFLKILIFCSGDGFIGISFFLRASKICEH